MDEPRKDFQYVGMKGKIDGNEIKNAVAIKVLTPNASLLFGRFIDATLARKRDVWVVLVDHEACTAFFEMCEKYGFKVG